MNKTALKTFATKSRKELLERVELQARKIGVTEENIKQATMESSDAIYIGDQQLSAVERKQRDKLIARVDKIGFQQVMEETAYTWFNRFVALRYMEVNDYLPTKVRVLSSVNKTSTTPDMIVEALSLDLPIDKEYIYELKMANKTDELFKYLIKLHCNDLNRYLPFMFESIDDYMLLLFPEGLLGPDSFVRDMTDVDVIPEESWEQVEVIGWLYQYYIAEENERVIRAKKRYKTEEIPYATQLFTPEWIVRYMVQNALGRYWVESHPEHRGFIDNWEFYLENPNPEADFEEKLKPYMNRELKVEDMTCFDPAMGSGHILVYMFDVLFEIYSKCGYMEREIPRLIIENNLYGLDIDDRAYQLACFSVVMKALQYNKRFLRSIERDGLKLNLAAIQETKQLDDEDIAFLAGEPSGETFEQMQAFIHLFTDAKAIGSLIKMEDISVKWLTERLTALEQRSGDLFELEQRERLLPLFKKLVNQAIIMNRTYDVLVTNPPYAARRYLTKEMTAYLDEHYSDVKSDLFSSFMEYSFRVTKKSGQMGLMTPYVWMFISSYGKLRKKIIEERNISSMIQLEYSGFEGATVPICTFTLRNYPSDTAGDYVRLADFRGAANQAVKTLEAVQDASVPYRYQVNQEDFTKIPGQPIAFWSSSATLKVYEQAVPLGDLASPKQGMATAHNKKFVRNWFEVSFNNIGFGAKDHLDAKNKKTKWFPYNNGGGYRKWYGNNIDVVNWENDGKELKDFPKSVIRNPAYYFKKGITWNAITSSKLSLRAFDEGFIFSNAGMAIFAEDTTLELLIAYLNSEVVQYVLSFVSNTLNFNQGDIVKAPIIMDEAYILTITAWSNENRTLAKNDWDSFETSWDFSKHPLLKFQAKTIESSFNAWERFAEKQFNELKENEEKLNQLFIQIYGLQSELTPDVADEDVSVRKAELGREMKSFISYAIGCMFGRYSLDEEGLVYAGGAFDLSRYETFPVDADNVLPILPGAYFEDDIVTRFVHFVETTYGADTLEENLAFIAKAIGRRKSETAREALRRYFLNDFYKDHVQMYKKRPIYWLFTSGREKAFNCLIYMHRYDQTTLSRIRTDYLHDVQTRYESERQDLLTLMEGEATAKEIRDAKKELTAVEKKIDELKKYDEKLHHMADMQIEIDLDDGVEANVAKFKGLVARI